MTEQPREYEYVHVCRRADLYDPKNWPAPSGKPVKMRLRVRVRRAWRALRHG